MQELTKNCPACHTEVRSTDYFCFNCGTNLKPAPKSTSASTQVIYYLGSLLLPPLGFWWGMKYLKEDNPKAKMVGTICVAITVFSLVVSFVLVKNIADNINNQISSQVNNFMSY